MWVTMVPYRTEEQWLRKLKEGVDTSFCFHWKHALNSINSIGIDAYVKTHEYNSDRINKEIKENKIVMDDTLSHFFYNKKLK